MKDQIDEDRSPFAIHPETVFKIPFSQDSSGRNAAELFDCPVPCQHLSLLVDDKGGIGEETDDVRKELPGLADLLFHPFAFRDVKIGAQKADCITLVIKQR